MKTADVAFQKLHASLNQKYQVPTVSDVIYVGRIVLHIILH